MTEPNIRAWAKRAGEAAPRDPGNVIRPEPPYQDIRIILSDHTIPNTKEEYGDSEVVCAEGIYELGLPILDIYVALRKQVQNKNTYKSPKLKAFYFVDIPFGENQAEIHKQELMESAIKDLIGVGALMGGLKTTLTRRRLLGIAITSIGAYFSTGKINKELTGYGYDYQLPTNKVEHNLPYVINFRNLVIAHKSAYISDLIYENTGNRPKIALTVGAHHAHIKDAFKIPARDRLDMMVNIAKELKDKIPKEEYDTLIIGLFLIPAVEKDENGEEISRFINILEENK